ncbi:MAG: hypothetical protein ACLTUL_03080 [Blautia faecis]
MNRDVYRKVQILQDEYEKLADGIRASYKSKDKNEKLISLLRYRMFYEKCRTELLYISTGYRAEAVGYADPNLIIQRETLGITRNPKTYYGMHSRKR